MSFTHRLATMDDREAIMALMDAAIVGNMASFLSRDQIEAARESMGIDHSLIQDGTYFCIEARQEGKTVLVGCGGWGKRKTLYGGDNTAGRDVSVTKLCASI